MRHTIYKLQLLLQFPSRSPELASYTLAHKFSMFKLRFTMDAGLTEKIMCQAATDNKRSIDTLTLEFEMDIAIERT